MNRGWWPPHESKRPPPAHGIKVQKPGATWWGARWIDALERLSRDYAGRLARGKTYARTGRTHDFEVKPGCVTAKVTGTREPYDVRIALAKLDEESWSRAIEAMAAKASFAAALLAGEMPREIDEAFRSAGEGTALFPRRPSELETSCSCPDSANPCKHVAATHYVLGDALDRDPFLLFELRGKTKDEVLAALRKLRGGARPSAKRRAAHVPSVVLRRAALERYDEWRTPPPDLGLTMQAPAASNTLLRHLGAPPSWREAPPLAERLADVVRGASEAARRIALAEALAEEAPCKEESDPA